MDVRNRTLVAGQCSVDLTDLVLDGGSVEDGNAEGLGFHVDDAAAAAERNGKIQALLVPFLPGIPAGKAAGVVDRGIVFDMLVRIPGFAVQAQQQVFTVILPVYLPLAEV